MSKHSSSSDDSNFYHNKGESDRAHSTDGEGQDNYNPPSSFDFTGGLLMSDKQYQDKLDYDNGWANHRDQKNH